LFALVFFTFSPNAGLPKRRSAPSGAPRVVRRGLTSNLAGAGRPLALHDGRARSDVADRAPERLGRSTCPRSARF
jgi:hypothetical protein